MKTATSSIRSHLQANCIRCWKNLWVLKPKTCYRVDFRLAVKRIAGCWSICKIPWEASLETIPSGMTEVLRTGDDKILSMFLESNVPEKLERDSWISRQSKKSKKH